MSKKEGDRILAASRHIGREFIRILRNAGVWGWRFGMMCLSMGIISCEALLRLTGVWTFSTSTLDIRLFFSCGSGVLRKRLGRRCCVRHFHPRSSADDEEDGYLSWVYYRAQNSGHESQLSIFIKRQMARVSRCSTRCTAYAERCSASVIFLTSFSLL